MIKKHFLIKTLIMGEDVKWRDQSCNTINRGDKGKIVSVSFIGNDHQFWRPGSIIISIDKENGGWFGFSYLNKFEFSNSKIQEILDELRKLPEEGLPEFSELLNRVDAKDKILSVENLIHGNV